MLPFCQAVWQDFEGPACRRQLSRDEIPCIDVAEQHRSTAATGTGGEQSSLSVPDVRLCRQCDVRSCLLRQRDQQRSKMALQVLKHLEPANGFSLWFAPRFVHVLWLCRGGRGDANASS